MRRLTEAEYQGLVKAAEVAQRFGDRVDQLSVEVNELTDALDAANAKAAYLERKIEVHTMVLHLAWGMWTANRRVLWALSRPWSKRGRAWVEAWLEKDKTDMMDVLDRADKQVDQ